jgi:hypothetical protein
MVFVIAAFLFALPPANDSSIAYRVPAKLTPDYGLLVDVTINGKASPFLCQYDSGADSVLVLDRMKAKAAGLSPTSTGLRAGCPANLNETSRTIVSCVRTMHPVGAALRQSPHRRPVSPASAMSEVV